jgi:hypothetical protein
MAPTNPIRYEVVQKASLNQEVFEVDRHYKNEIDYFMNVKKYKFVFCCEGNGFENHRIWESLYQNTFPVMLDTAFSRNISSLGLPILIVKGISDLHPTLLNNFFEDWKTFDAKNEPKLWIDYWAKLFNSYL